MKLKQAVEKVCRDDKNRVMVVVDTSQELPDSILEDIKNN